jgi:hypothetical protein
MLIQSKLLLGKNETVLSEELVLNLFVVAFGPLFAGSYGRRGGPRRTCRPKLVVKHIDAAEVRIAVVGVFAVAADAVLVAPCSLHTISQILLPI